VADTGKKKPGVGEMRGGKGGRGSKRRVNKCSEKKRGRNSSMLIGTGAEKGVVWGESNRMDLQSDHPFRGKGVGNIGWTIWPETVLNRGGWKTKGIWPFGKKG